MDQRWKRYGFGKPEEQPPRVCRCKRALSAPVYKEGHHLPVWHPARQGYFVGTSFQECTCGTVYVWSFPNVWKETHVLELGR